MDNYEIIHQDIHNLDITEEAIHHLHDEADPVAPATYEQDENLKEIRENIIRHLGEVVGLHTIALPGVKL